MAEQIDPAQLQAANASMKEAANLAEILAKQASQATGEVAKNLDRMSALFDSMSKNNKELLLSEEKLRKIQEERARAYADLEKAKKKGTEADQAAAKKKLVELRDQANSERSILDLKQKQISAQQKYVQELGKSKSLLGEFFSNGKAQVLGYLASSAQLTRALSSIAKMAQDVADISIQSGSFFGMTGHLAADLGNIGLATISYSKNLAGVTYEMGKLGISTEEGSQAFKEFSQIVKNPGTAAAATEMKNLTVVTGQLSKVLGVSMPEATDYLVESQLKFNRTGQQSAMTLYSIFNATEKYNREVGQTVIRGRDVTKVIFDLARESQGAAQDQEVLARTLSANLVMLQGQGMNYREALAGASGYIKKLTAEAPDWMKILSGRDLMKTFGEFGQSLTSEMAKQLDAARPGLSDRVKKILKDPSLSAYAKQGLLQEALEGTKFGLESMQKELNRVITQSGGRALETVQAIYGVTKSEASRMIEQNKSWKVQADLRADMLDSTKSAADIAAKYNQGLKEADQITAETVENIRAGKDETIAKSLIEKKAAQESVQATIAQKELEKNRADQAEAQRIADIQSYKQKRDMTKDEATRRALQEQIVKLEGQPLKEVSDKLGERLQGFTIATGGYVKGFYDFITKSGVGQLATSIAGFAILQFTAKQQLKVLGEIKNLLGGSGGAGSGGAMDAAFGWAKKTKAGKAITSRVGAIGNVATSVLQKTGLGSKLAKLGAGRLGKGLLGAGGALGIDALMNAPEIISDFKTGGAGAGAKSIVSNTLGKMGIGTAIGTALGTVLPGFGNIIGGAVGGVLDSALDLPTLGDLYGMAEKGIAGASASSPLPAGIGGSNGGFPGSGGNFAGNSGGGPTLTGQNVSTSQGMNHRVTATWEIPMANIQASNMAMANRYSAQ